MVVQVSEEIKPCRQLPKRNERLLENYSPPTIWEHAHFLPRIREPKYLLHLL